MTKKELEEKITHLEKDIVALQLQINSLETKQPIYQYCLCSWHNHYYWSNQPIWPPVYTTFTAGTTTTILVPQQI